MRGDRFFRLLAGIAAFMVGPAGFGQQAPAQTASVVTAPSDVDSERVVVTGKPTRRMVYEFYQQLTSNDFCPRGLVTPRGYSCAEVTYDVFDASGKQLGQCNVPIFRLYRSVFQYMAVTYEKFDCSVENPKGRTVAVVLLEELSNPRTKDGTVFKKVSVMGIDQARELCKVSADLCVLKLFDRQGEMAYCTLQQLWGVPGQESVCQKRR